MYAQLELLDTKQQFLNWLNTKPSSYVVGIAGRPNYCPIAEFVSAEIKPQCRAVVSDCSLRIGEKQYHLPYWVRYFITCVDRNKTIYITKERAINILGHIL